MDREKRFLVKISHGLNMAEKGLEPQGTVSFFAPSISEGYSYMPDGLGLY